MKEFILQICLIVLLLIPFSRLTAQTDDHIIWASLKVQKSISSKTSLALAPIVRINEDISNYQNSSIDISIRHKFGKGWSTALLSRTWFIPKGDNRQFLWFDLAYGKEFTNFKVGSSLRMHYALDVFDNNDADFLRWKTTFTLLKMKKISPFIAIEPWFRLNSANEIQRIRYEPGFKFKMLKSLDLLAILRREESINLKPSLKVNIYIITLVYSL